MRAIYEQLVDALNDDFDATTLNNLRAACARAAEEDERVYAVSLDMPLVGTTMTVTAQVQSSAGPFELVGTLNSGIIEKLVIQ